jgi:medium-chain acyl-[acyl-carrier-protein] hydrolase
MGALLAFELAWELRSSGREIKTLFVSGHPAPQLPWIRPAISHLDPKSFAQGLVKKFGANDAILSSEDLLAFIYPSLRADFEMVENYIFQYRGKLDCPISVFGGVNDPEASEDELTAWREQASGPFHLRFLAGNHNFVHDSAASLLEAIKFDLGV